MARKHNFTPGIPKILRKRRIKITQLAEMLGEDYYAVRRAVTLEGEYLNLPIFYKVLNALDLSVNDAIGQEPNDESILSGNNRGQL